MRKVINIGKLLSLHVAFFLSSLLAAEHLYIWPLASLCPSVLRGLCALCCIIILACCMHVFIEILILVYSLFLWENNKWKTFYVCIIEKKTNLLCKKMVAIETRKLVFGMPRTSVKITINTYCNRDIRMGPQRCKNVCVYW